MTALIIGGGLSGLVTALCLAKTGWHCTILERAPQIEAVGAGIQLGPNAMRVMAALGLDDAIIAAGFTPHAIELRDGKSGKNLVSAALGAHSIQRWGAAYIQIHRADLMTILRDAISDISGQTGTVDMHIGVAVSGFTQDANGITAHIKGHKTPYKGDILIGADGLNSAIRAQISPTAKPRFTGHMAWRLTVPLARLGRNAPPPSACAWLGKGRHAVTYLIRNGTLANFVGVVERADFQDEAWDRIGNGADALRDFAGWHPVIQTMIEQADTHFRWALFDRKPLKRWSDGRAIILGDACHPMLPYLAQGAAMGIEDGWILSQLLSASPYPTAFSRFQALRGPRTARVQAAARANARHFHGVSPLAQLGNSGALKALNILRPDSFMRQFDWLYGYDATKFVA